jgi:hypothetical protein
MRSGPCATGLILIALIATGCDPPNCSAYSVTGLGVTVVDSTQSPVCDAVVTAKDGGYTEELMLVTGGPCVYVGAVERAGTYSITAKRQGASGRLNGVKVTADQCHVHPVTATITIAG